MYVATNYSKNNLLYLTHENGTIMLTRNAGN